MKFENKIKDLHFYTFASGSYSDYGVNALAVCDHAITQEEWYENLKEYRVLCEVKRKEIKEKYDVYYDYFPYGSDSRKEFDAWLEDNDSDKTFAKKHGMIFVEYQECHKDD